MELDAVLRDTIFPRVVKPSRYLGTEVNSVHKDLKTVDVRFALCFPDLYDLGLGNLGLHILYAVLNAVDGVWAERAYAPAVDMEHELRSRGLKLFALESKHSLDRFDGIGFTLQSELTYTNILNILDLSGIPLRTCDRRPTDPLTFAGGPAVFNPEPLAPFMDFFVIGDGEDIVLEIAEVFRRFRGREQRLDALAQVPGIYVPARYTMDVLPDGRILPPVDGPRIVKRTTRDLNGSTFPVNYIVPFTEQVHDRVSLEVLRGCTQGCRFCQAGMTTRPVRERTIDNLEDLMDRTLAATGYEEVSLVSLSTCDYSRVRQMVERMVAKARPQRVTVSLPSLRLDSFSVALADMVADTRRSGLTFAPEAASPRLRAVINKWIPDEDLIEMATETFARGWDHVKLYFMIGLPTERDEDVLAIADLCERVVAAGRKYNRKASVHTGVSSFVPKPFTPFQWAPQIDMAETERRQGLLQDRFARNRFIRFGRHQPLETWLEGLVSRSDRRFADVIEAAWRNGARFDAWREHCDERAWRKALDQTGFDPGFGLRERGLDERLPWDHIDIHIPKAWFVDDWNRAMVLQHAPDCRASHCHRCGVIDVHRPLCASMLRNSIAGAKEEKTWTRTLNPEVVEPAVVQRVRLRIGRVGEARFLGHLEAMHAWLRALRRVDAPLAWSQGFHAHPKMTFSTAVPLGEASEADYLDVMLTKQVEPAVLLQKLAATLPEGFSVTSVEEVELRAPAISNLVTGFRYRLTTTGVPDLAARVAKLTDAPTLEVERESKEGKRSTVDLRPLIRSLTVDGDVVRYETTVDNGRYAKAKELVALLGLEGDVLVCKEDTLLHKG